MALKTPLLLVLAIVSLATTPASLSAAEKIVTVSDGHTFVLSDVSALVLTSPGKTQVHLKGGQIVTVNDSAGKALADALEKYHGKK